MQSNGSIADREEAAYACCNLALRQPDEKQAKTLLRQAKKQMYSILDNDQNAADRVDHVIRATTKLVKKILEGESVTPDDVANLPEPFQGFLQRNEIELHLIRAESKQEDSKGKEPEVEKDETNGDTDNSGTDEENTAHEENPPPSAPIPEVEDAALPIQEDAPMADATTQNIEALYRHISKRILGVADFCKERAEALSPDYYAAAEELSTLAVTLTRLAMNLFHHAEEGVQATPDMNIWNPFIDQALDMTRYREALKKKLREMRADEEERIHIAIIASQSTAAANFLEERVTMVTLILLLRTHGEFISLKQAADETGYSKESIRNAIRNLRGNTELHIKSNNKSRDELAWRLERSISAHPSAAVPTEHLHSPDHR